MPSDSAPVVLETAVRWARSGNEFNKVFRFLFLHPDDFFTIPKNRTWPIAHQLVYHGDVELIKRCLALFSDDQINIRTVANDNKTLLDVATERRKTHPLMYNFMEHLFLQDDLIQAAKESNWNLVSNILEKKPELINEKPPYSTYYLLHYVIQNGDKTIFDDLSRRFQFRIDVLSADNETPLCLAQRLKKVDMYSSLKPTTRERPNPNSMTYRSPSSDVNPQDEKQTNPAPTTASVESLLPYPKEDTFPGFGFCKIVLEIGASGNFIFPEQNPFASNEHVDTSKVSAQQDQKTELEPSLMTPITPASNSRLIKNLTCPLTQQPFVDPVITSDGQTYERAAITEYVNLHRYSPMTGASMDTKFRDNTEIRQIMQTMGKKN